MYSVVQLLLLITGINLVVGFAIDIRSTPIRTLVESVKSEEESCSEYGDFIGLFIDHMLRRLPRSMDLGDKSIFPVLDLNDIKLYGLDTLKRACPVRIEIEHIESQPTNSSNTTLPINNSTNQNVEQEQHVAHLSTCFRLDQLILKANGSIGFSLFTLTPKPLEVSTSDALIDLQINLHLLSPTDRGFYVSQSLEFSELGYINVLEDGRRLVWPETQLNGSVKPYLVELFKNNLNKFVKEKLNFTRTDLSPQMTDVE